MNKSLIITGPTATGKTKLGIEIAQKYGGEIISADSRQVYRYMDIGTGKDREECKRAGIPLHGTDLVDPDYHFNVSDFCDFAIPKIAEIHKRGKLPIVVGGTAQYIRALIEPFATLNVPPDETLRQLLSQEPVEKLQQILQQKDPQKWEKMNESDKNNPRRLVRAIEIAHQTQETGDGGRGWGKESSSENLNTSFPTLVSNPISHYQTLASRYMIISLTAPREYLNQKIDDRVEKRLQEGMAQEVQTLLQKGYGFSLPSMSGLGYREYSKWNSSSIQRWKTSEHQYAKRQETYINKYLHPQKFDITSPNYPECVFSFVGSWYIGTSVQKTD